jgi:hypothetical protein
MATKKSGLQMIPNRHQDEEPQDSRPEAVRFSIWRIISSLEEKNKALRDRVYKLEIIIAHIKASGMMVVPSKLANKYGNITHIYSSQRRWSL